MFIVQMLKDFVLFIISTFITGLFLFGLSIAAMGFFAHIGLETYAFLSTVHPALAALSSIVIFGLFYGFYHLTYMMWEKTMLFIFNIFD